MTPDATEVSCCHASSAGALAGFACTGAPVPRAKTKGACLPCPSPSPLILLALRQLILNDARRVFSPVHQHLHRSLTLSLTSQCVLHQGRTPAHAKPLSNEQYSKSATAQHS